MTNPMTNPATGVAVKYTGRENPFIERNYGSSLSFDQGQVRVVPVELAAKLLRHADVFTPGDVADAAPVEPAGDGTQSTLDVAAKAKAEQDASNNLRQDVVDTINRMDKDALKDYAQLNYGQPIPKTLTIENMRAKVVGLIDQFGLV